VELEGKFAAENKFRFDSIWIWIWRSLLILEQLAQELEPWPEVNGVRRASVNNFGYGGSNAHVIMESYQSFLDGQKRQRNGLATDGSTNCTNGANGYHIPITNSTNGYDTPITNGSDGSDGCHTPIIDGTNGTKGTNENHTLMIDSTNGYHCHNGTNGVNGTHIEQITTNGVASNGYTNGNSKGDRSNLKSRVITLSAKDEQAALDMASNLKEYLETVNVASEESFFDNLAYTLGQRRTALTWAAAHPAESVAGLVKALEVGKFKPARKSEAPKISFVFTGQGAQWHAMGRELIEAYPVFKNTLLEAEVCLRDFGCKWSLIGMSKL
jgi:acyl transferase domain-containing protein